jgi:hypothetical protein
MAQEAEGLIGVADDDSVLGSYESTYTETLRTSLRQSVRENGRAYHRYRDGQYILPDDEKEQERLDMQHEMFLRTLDRKPLLVPIPDKVHDAIDIGTGTGIW